MNKIAKASELIENALQVLVGDYYNIEELNKTSERVANVWYEMSEGVYEEKPDLKWFESKSNSLVIKGPIEASFLCLHHLFPTSIRVMIGYIPDGYVIGLSKITRNVLWASKRFTLQEDLTKMITDIFWEVPDVYRPKGLIVAIIGDHSCEKTRGIKKKSVTTTIDKRGELNEEDILIFMENLNKTKENFDD